MGLKVKASSPNAGEDTDLKTPWRPIANWLRFLVAPGSNLELRVIGVTRNGSRVAHAESSHYVHEGDQLERLAKAALTINHRSEGVYWTLNPLLAGPALEGRAATDADVLSRRWLLIDCDPVRHLSGGQVAKVSATDAEKARAKTTSDLIRLSLSSRGWPNPIEADSGNGYHLLYRIDLPNDDASKDLVRRVLKGIAAEFDSDGVKIDTSVFNASRICKLYGTTARKGPDQIDRPHRVSTILTPFPFSASVVPVDLLERVADTVKEGRQGTASPPPSVADKQFPSRSKGLVAKAGRTDPFSRAEIYAERCQPAISGEGGHSQTLKVAIAIGPGFDLSEDDAYRIMSEHYNPKCEPPWEEKDLRRKVSEAYKVERQRGWMLKVDHRATATRKAVVADDGERLESPDDPHRLARLFLANEFSHKESGWPVLAFWGETWQWWHAGYWRPVAADEISSIVTRLIKVEFDRIASDIGKASKPVTRGVVGNVMQALRDLCLLPTWLVPRQPMWLESDGKEHTDPVDYLAASNAIIHLPSLVEGQPCTLAPTPRWFSPTNLGYEFDPSAPAPEAWLNFLSDLWPDDPQSVSCLQEWMGYLLTPDTSQNKILMLIGPKRSGKGTIGRVIQGLVGAANIAAPTLASMERNFGLSALIGKLIAIIGDARLSGRSDSQAIVERLLSISGQDAQTIDRKNQSLWTGNLSTRFVLISNELPRLPDASGSLPSRMVLLQMTRSFFGKEDTTLTERLMAERPAILLWAIAGWARLRSRGYFVQPASGQEYMDELLSLSSPITSFLTEECVVGPEYRIPVSDLYLAWKKWCETRGRDHPGDESGFGRNLKAACVGVKVTRPRAGESRIRMYEGIALASSQGELY